MAIFIISNRETKTVDGELKFKNDPDGKAGHDFRVAEYDSKKQQYKIIADLDEYGYTGVASKKPSSLAGSAYMFNKLFKANVGSKAGDILTFIHGFNYKLEDNLEHIDKLEELYMGKGSNIKHLVYVSWPSRGNFFSYKSDQPDARETGRVLARVFEKLRRFFIDTFDKTKTEPCRNRIHLAAHSMGNQVLYHMLQSLDDSQKMPLFCEALLLNADAPDDGFEPGRPYTVLEEIAERTHVYIHKSDDALWISDNLKGNSKRMGRRGPRDPMSLSSETFVVDCSDLKEASSKKEKAIDHWGYLRRDTVIEDVRAVLAGVDEEDFPSRDEMALGQYYKLKEWI